MKEAATQLPEACSQWAEQLNAVHHDDLPFEQRLELRKHLEICPNCKAVKAEYRAMDALITGLPEVEPLTGLPAHLQELIGAYEEAEQLQGQINPSEEISSSTTNDYASTRSRLYPRHGRVLVKKFNLVAAVLVVMTILGGFLALSAVQRSNNASAHQGAIYLFTSAFQNGADVMLLSARDPSDHSLIWQRTLPMGLSLPAQVADGHIYYSLADGSVYALSASDGETIWHTRITPNQTSYPFQIHGDMLFVGTTNGDLYGLKTSTGAIAWSRHFLGCTTPGATFPGGVGCDVILEDQSNGILYGGISFDSGPPDSPITGSYAWSEANGQTIWHEHTLDYVSTVTHSKIYSVTSNGKINVLNASTGSFLHTLKKSETSMVQQMAVNANVLYFTDGSNMLFAYSLSDDTLLWQKQLTRRSNAELSVTNSTLYVLESNGSAPGQATDLYALDANKGTQVWHWHGSETGANPPIEINGVLCLDTIDGVYAFQASDGHLLWKLPEPGLSDVISDMTS